VFAYGVTSQGMLYPNEKNVWRAIGGIIYKPYWQLFGELFLEETDFDPGMLTFALQNMHLLRHMGKM